MIVDNESKLRGLMDKEMGVGTTWLGPSLKPLKKFTNNFIVVSTDYENYLITYQCTYRTVMYNKDIITIYVRDPDISILNDGTFDIIRSEFGRIFGEEQEEIDEEM